MSPLDLIVHDVQAAHFHELFKQLSRLDLCAGCNTWGSDMVPQLMFEEQQRSQSVTRRNNVFGVRIIQLSNVVY